MFKELIPTILFPSDAEYRKVLENYLAEHASHYIENLGRNIWVFIFKLKLLPEICKIVNNNQNNQNNKYLIFKIKNKCRSK